jgi:hypothetical protein
MCLRGCQETSRHLFRLQVEWETRRNSNSNVTVHTWRGSYVSMEIEICRTWRYAMEHFEDSRNSPFESGKYTSLQFKLKSHLSNISKYCSRKHSVAITNILWCVYSLLCNDSVGANARNNRKSTARQQRGKRASSTIEVVFSAWSVQNNYKEVFGSIQQDWIELSFETQACQDMSLRAEELNWVESSELAVAE